MLCKSVRVVCASKTPHAHTDFSLNWPLGCFSLYFGMSWCFFTPLPASLKWCGMETFGRRAYSKHCKPKVWVNYFSLEKKEEKKIGGVLSEFTPFMPWPAFLKGFWSDDEDVPPPPPSSPPPLPSIFYFFYFYLQTLKGLVFFLFMATVLIFSFSRSISSAKPRR